MLSFSASAWGHLLASRSGDLPGPALILVGVSFLNRAQEKALAQAVRGFTDWVKSQPPGKRLYDRYYNP